MLKRIEDGQYNRINTPNVLSAGQSLSEGMLNNTMINTKAAHITTIRPAKTMKYVTKYMEKDNPFTRSWFFAFIWKTRRSVKRRRQLKMCLSPLCHIPCPPPNWPAPIQKSSPWRWPSRRRRNWTPPAGKFAEMVGPLPLSVATYWCFPHSSYSTWKGNVERAYKIGGYDLPPQCFCCDNCFMPLNCRVGFEVFKVEVL